MDDAARDGASWESTPGERGSVPSGNEVPEVASGGTDVIGRYFDLYKYTCAPGVAFTWDPNGWARCHIRCDCGEWWRDSHDLNVTEAFVLARQEWASGAVHPSWEQEDEDFGQ
jgi:hypothetical protein